MSVDDAASLAARPLELELDLLSAIVTAQWTASGTPTIACFTLDHALHRDLRIQMHLSRYDDHRHSG
jgi:hypothetical protein